MVQGILCFFHFFLKKLIRNQCGNWHHSKNNVHLSFSCCCRSDFLLRRFAFFADTLAYASDVPPPTSHGQPLRLLPGLTLPLDLICARGLKPSCLHSDAEG